MRVLIGHSIDHESLIIDHSLWSVSKILLTLALAPIPIISGEFRSLLAMTDFANRRNTAKLTFSRILFEKWLCLDDWHREEFDRARQYFRLIPGSHYIITHRLHRRCRNGWSAAIDSTVQTGRQQKYELYTNVGIRIV